MPLLTTKQIRQSMWDGNAWFSAGLKIFQENA